MKIEAKHANIHEFNFGDIPYGFVFSIPEKSPGQLFIKVRAEGKDYRVDLSNGRASGTLDTVKCVVHDQVFLGGKL